MKPKIVLIFLFSFMGFTSAFPQWQVVHSGAGGTLVDGCFLTDSIGVVIGSSGVILRTTDQGTTWSPQASLQGHYTSICSAGQDTLIAAGNYVYRSIDMGNTWELVRDLGDTISDLMFFGSGKGFSIVRDRYLCHWAGLDYYVDDYHVAQSVDDGTTWQNIFDAGEQTSYFQKLNDSVAYMFGGTFLVYPHCGESWWNTSRKTWNKGVTWDGAYLPGSDSWFSMFSADSGYCVRPQYYHDIIWRTTDGTQTLQPCTTEITDSSVNQCLFVNGIDGYLKADHDIYITKANGLIWNNDYHLSQTLNHLFYISSHFMFAIGTGGTILKKYVTESAYPDPVYRLKLDSYTLDFGVQSVNNSAIRQLTVSNAGNVLLNLSAGLSDDFKISLTGNSFSNNLSFALPPFQDTTMYVLFTPLLAQTYYDTITLSADSIDPIHIPVTGTGIYGIGGVISKDTLLCSDTLMIGADVQIPEGVKVTICPGTYVKILGEFEIDIEGQLVAQGDSLAQIRFRMAGKNPFWNGIHVIHKDYQDTTVLSWCDFSLPCRIFSDHCLSIDNGIVIADHCTFDNQTVGSGIYINGLGSRLILKNSRILNTRWGVYCFLCDSTFILDNSIFNNELGITSMTDNGIVIRGNDIFNNSGGGIGAHDHAWIEHNKIYHNGGGVFFTGFSDCDLWIGNNEIYNNYSYMTGGLFIGMSGGNCSILQNLIYNNKVSGNYCGGIDFSVSSSHTSNFCLSSNTICNNLSNNGTTNDLYIGKGTTADLIAKVVNNIIYNVWPADEKVAWKGMTPEFYFNCVNQDNIPGTGNLNAEPIFKHPSTFSGNSENFGKYDWTLKITSPCINNGDTLHPEFQFPFDIAGNPRIFEERIDIGAYECQDSVPKPGIIIEEEPGRDVSVYPNPSRGMINIYANSNSPAEFLLYDISGRKVLSQDFIRFTSIDIHPVDRGVYFYTVQNKDGLMHIGKIIRE